MVPARIVIVGGGPAGSVAGFYLARFGFNVTIVERARFPRVKVCGEFVSPAATGVLEAVVDAGALRSAGARLVDRFVMELGERQWAWPMPEPAWALSRATLDRLLIERAREAGATVIQPANVQRVEYRQDGVSVVLADRGPIECDLVVHADGSGRHDPAGPVPCDRGLVGHKCHLRVPGPGIEGVRIRAGAAAYLGTIAVEGGLSTCALVAGKKSISRHGGDVDAMVVELWPGFDPSWRTSQWKSCGVPRSGYVKPGHLRSFRLGNAAAAVDPVGGEGIGLALWSGTMIARLLEAADGAARPRQRVGMSLESLASVHRTFSRLYRRRLLARLPACRLAAQLLMRPRLLGSLWPLLTVPGLSVRPWYALTGKPVGGLVAAEE